MIGKCLFLIVYLFSFNAFADAQITCPKQSPKNRYISVPVIHDLSKIARVENIPNLNLHEKLLAKYDGVKLSVHFKYLNSFDKNKETILFIPGGPGQTIAGIETFIEVTNEKSDFFTKYNAIAMDHRGSGCSIETTTGKLPPESHKMRFAASDLEMIRQKITPGKKIHVFGYSYGSVLAQTFALLYPASLDLLYLGGSYRKASEFMDIRLNYEKLVIESSTGAIDYNSLVTKYPQYRDRFLDYTVSEMYWVGGRTIEIPKFLKSILKLLDMNLGFMVDNMFKAQGSAIISPLMNSVGCSEVFDYREATGAYPMFRDVYKLCQKETIRKDYFDYSMLYSNIQSRTFIWGAKYDHVTGPAPMVKMAESIKGSFIYIDQHLGHIPYNKAKCMAQTMEAFFAGKSNQKLEEVVKGPDCTNVPMILSPRRL